MKEIVDFACVSITSVDFVHVSAEVVAERRGASRELFARLAIPAGF